MRDDEDVSHGIGQDAKSGGAIDGFKFTVLCGNWKQRIIFYIEK